MIKLYNHLLITFVLLIFISCSKEDISLFYDQVEGKVFVRVDLIESSNKSIDQVDPSEYSLLIFFFHRYNFLNINNSNFFSFLII